MRWRKATPHNPSQTTENKKKNTSRKIDADKAKGIDLCYLCERPRSALDAELCVAELAVAGVGRRQPLLQAALVHFPQRTGAVAGGEQRLPSGSLMADPTHAHITVERSGEDVTM